MDANMSMCRGCSENRDSKCTNVGKYGSNKGIIGVCWMEEEYAYNIMSQSICNGCKYMEEVCKCNIICRDRSMYKEA